jgi:hypothetical protein
VSARPPAVPAHAGTSDVDIVVDLQILADIDAYHTLEQNLRETRQLGELYLPEGVCFRRSNVAVSRAKWRAVIVRSAALTSYMPSSPAELLELGAFIGLCEGSS